MSSHHIIRENQEPALLIQDFKALDLESFGQLLEWSPTIVTDNENVDSLLAEGIKIDVLFSNQEGHLLQEHTKLLTYDTDFLRAALAYLIEHKHKAVNILSSYIPEVLYLLAKRINIVLFSNHKRYVFVQSSFEKWKPQGEFIYLDQKFIKSYQGLDYISDGVFRTVEDGFIKLEFSTVDFVLLGEDL